MDTDRKKKCWRKEEDERPIDEPAAQQPHVRIQLLYIHLRTHTTTTSSSSSEKDKGN